GPQGRAAEEPREERQLLQMVGETVGHCHVREVHVSQRVSHFKAFLTITRHLSNISPGWGGIGGERVGQPFGDLVRQSRGILALSTKSPGGVELSYCVGLGGEAERTVVAKDAAVACAGVVQHHVTEDKDREGGGVHALRRQRGDKCACHKVVKPVYLHKSKIPTPARRPR